MILLKLFYVELYSVHSTVTLFNTSILSLISRIHNSKIIVFPASENSFTKKFIQMPNRSLPDNWLNCPQFGETIEGVVPIKVPLDPQYRYARAKRWSWEEALAKYPQIGLGNGSLFFLYLSVLSSCRSDEYGSLLRQTAALRSRYWVHQSQDARARTNPFATRNLYSCWQDQRFHRRASRQNSSCPLHAWLQSHRIPCLRLSPFTQGIYYPTRRRKFCKGSTRWHLSDGNHPGASWFLPRRKGYSRRGSQASVAYNRKEEKLPRGAKESVSEEKEGRARKRGYRHCWQASKERAKGLGWKGTLR